MSDDESPHGKRLLDIRTSNFDPRPMEPTDRIKAQLMDPDDLRRTLDRMARQIVELIDPEADPSDTFALIGMQTRGVYLARRLRDRIQSVEGLDIPVGTLDATMYRDDVHLRAQQPVVRATRIPFDISGRHLVLVDDVVYTGRTVRAALDALMDMGRPASVRFLVIVDRGHRELPIAADIVGRKVPTLPGEMVRVRLDEVDGREGVWLVEAERTEEASSSRT
jgi:pyrimidine operon attenuation protein/uracil phosphoribosyltransferase